MMKKYIFVDHIVKIGKHEVSLCRDPITNELVVIKTILIPECQISEGVPISVIREASLLGDLDHRNVIKLHGIQRRENHKIDLILEYMDMDLSKLIRDQKIKGKMLDQLLIKNVLYQILSGLDHCHSRKILHRDLKPNNILVDMKNRVVKIGDFGTGKDVAFPGELTPNVGTLNYNAPEILLGLTRYSNSVDIWSVGCIFVEMVTGRALFRQMVPTDVLDEIFSYFGVPDNNMMENVTSMPQYEAVMKVFKPDRKLGLVKEVADLDPPGMEFLTKMLKLDPAKRISAKEALKDDYLKDAQNDSNWKL